MQIKITKLKELPDALHPNNIEEGFARVFEMPDTFFKKPVIGDRFYASFSWSTSAVQEIIDDKTFRTYNSIYQWQII